MFLNPDVVVISWVTVLAIVECFASSSEESLFEFPLAYKPLKSLTRDFLVLTCKIG